MRFKLLVFSYIVIFTSSCAHYFPSQSVVKVNFKLHEIKSVCLKEGESIDASHILSKENSRFGNLYNLLEKNYKDIRIDCENKKSATIVFNETEKELFGDFWIISFGIIPGVYSKVYNVKIYSLEKQLVYESNGTGKNIISIFLAPFYFFNKKSYNIVYDEFENYLRSTIMLENDDT